MNSNTFGQLFRVTTFGESHGFGIGAVIDGCPPGLELSEADIQKELDRRKPGQSSFVSQRRETDQVKILSGVYLGKTLGTPIALLIENVDQRPRDYENIADLFRPGHADYTYQLKYGIRDPRGGGRSSARETAARVAAGAIAKKYLREKFKTEVRGCLMQIGPHKVETIDWNVVSENPYFCPDAAFVPKLEQCIRDLQKSGDSYGALIYLEANSVPGGLGEPVFDRLDAEIAHALMSINAVKAVEIGDGFASVAQKGSEHRDEMTPQGFLSNHAGGILGGISTGQTIVSRIAVKPTSSIRLPAKTINSLSQASEIVTTGRHDPCVGIRAVPIAEAMLALVIMDHALRDRAQNIDVKRVKFYE